MQSLGERIALIAFEGWNDANEAATGALDAMRAARETTVAFDVDPEDYYDYQYTRPRARRLEDATRVFDWPGATVHRTKNAQPLWFVKGQEPARRWQRFAGELVGALKNEGVTGAILIGSLLTDVPHTRPVLMQSTSENEAVRAEFDVERGRYEGPVGILTVLAQECEAHGISTLNEWASLPHYLPAQTPSPVGTLALMDRVTERTGQTFAREALEVEGRKWQASVDAAMMDDPEMIEYIRTLEESRDAWDTPAAKGDAIAREFEQFLRRGGEGPASGPQPLT